MAEQNEIVLYQTEDGKVKLDVQMHDESMWLTQEQMVTLFQRDKSVISRHIKNIFEEGELNEMSTVAYFATVQQESTSAKNAFVPSTRSRSYEILFPQISSARVIAGRA